MILRISSRIALIAGICAYCACSAAKPPAREAGTIIEMEDFDARQPDDGTFATPTLEMAGSKRRVLFRFYRTGRVTYRFDVGEPGEHTGWIRYGAKHEQELPVAVDPAAEPEFTRATLPPTGGYIGYGVWGWARIFHKNLRAGQHELVIGNAALRPDCIYITSGDQRPTDDLIMTNWQQQLGEDAFQRASKPLGEARPDWLQGAGGYELPEWYDNCRVQLHTRLSPRWMDRPIFLSAADALRSVGVRTFVRHIKTGSEGAWWPSSVGAVHPKAQDRNLAKQIIDNAHNAGCRIIVYHRHIEDDYIAEQHPDWAVRDHEGNMIERRGPMICFNSPYDDFVLKRLLELVDMGADGLFFDEVHMPKRGCWCSFCREKFKQQSGLEHPPFPDPKNPVWHRLLDFNNMTIERVFRKWRRAIHERNADVVMLIGSNKWPTMASRTMNQRLFRIADSMKTEFSLPRRMHNAHIPLGRDMAPLDPEVKVALGYVLSRDSADGRPAHIWAHGILDSTSMLYAAAGMIAHGCIANLDVSEGTIPNMMFKPAFELGDRASPYFADTTPLRWAMIHYPELARDRLALEPDRAWEEILYPTYGAYMALFEARLPAGILTDSQLAEGIPESCRVLFLPAPDDVTEAMRTAAAQFENNGGLVITQQPDWDWHDPQRQDLAKEAFMGELAGEIPDAPVQVFGGPDRLHTDSFVSDDPDRIVVAIANEFQWVHTGRRPDPDRIDELTETPPNCTGVEVELRGARSPQRVFDAVTGEPLNFEETQGSIRVTVPEFEQMALVVAEF